MRRQRYVILAFVTACGDGGGFPDAYKAPPVESGTFSLQWVVQNATCDQTTTVHVGITNHTSQAQYAAGFECDLGAGVSGQLFTGAYDLTFSLLAGTAVIATAPAASVVVTTETTTVPTVMFTAP